MKSDALLTI